MTFNIGDRVRHNNTGKDAGIGTVVRSNDKQTVVDWDRGCRLFNIVGSGAHHNTQFLTLFEPAFIEYDPTQMGDTEEDI